MHTPSTSIRVTSWAELNDAFYENSWQATIGRHRSTFAFRGMSSSAADLRNSLVRGGYVHQEQHLLRNFQKYARRGIEISDSLWTWLALAQHHGLPTRLLDWTYSPFVALHFATASLEHLDLDGVIYCFDYAGGNELLPQRLREILRAEGSAVFTSEMLNRVADSLAAFDQLGEEEFVIFFEPPSLDERIINQFALFSLMSSSSADLGRFLHEHPSLFRELIIPAEMKWEFRDKLDQANISERVLFPGLDGLSSWLKRYYAPSRRRAPAEWESDRVGIAPSMEDPHEKR